MTAVSFYRFWCWSFLHLGCVFPGGPRAGRPALLSWLCHGLLQRCQGSRKSHGQRAQVSSRSGRIQDLPGSCESPSGHPPKRCSRCRLPQLPSPALSRYLVVCAQTQRSTRQLNGPEEQLAHVSPKRQPCRVQSTACSVEPEHLWGGGLQHLQNRPCPSRSRSGKIWPKRIPCNLLLLRLSGQAALCCFVPRLMLTLLHGKGQEPLSSWSGSHLVPL